MDQLTPNQVARAIGVSTASLKRWCDKGVLPYVRTCGGHRRLPLSGVIQFLRETGRELVDPEVLRLPATTGNGRTVCSRAVRQLTDALVAGEEVQVGRIVFDLYLAKQSAREICDEIVRAAFACIGQRWEEGALEVYEERRACEICKCALRQLGRLLPEPGPDAPVALGGAPSGDPYCLPTQTVAVTLRELGWRAESLGSDLPLDTLVAATRRVRPGLVWVSVTTISDRDSFVADFARLRAATQEAGAALVVGGQALDHSIRSRMSYTAHCDRLDHLVGFVHQMKS